MNKDLPPTKDVSLEDYNRLKVENSELKKRINELEAENLKLKSKRPFNGGYRID